jgi:hypothetical protein
MLDQTLEFTLPGPSENGPVRFRLDITVVPIELVLRRVAGQSRVEMLTNGGLRICNIEILVSWIALRDERNTLIKETYYVSVSIKVTMAKLHTSVLSSVLKPPAGNQLWVLVRMPDLTPMNETANRIQSNM